MEIYCNFAFRRQVKENYIILTNIFYADKEMTKQIERKTRAYKMWENQQYVCAVQSYEYALNCIFESEYQMRKHGVTKVWLITANSALVSWIVGSRRAEYNNMLFKAKQPYMPGGAKEIHVEVGVLPAIDYDPAYKYCRVQNVTNEIPFTKKDEAVSKLNVLGMSIFDNIENMMKDTLKEDKKHVDEDIFR